MFIESGFVYCCLWVCPHHQKYLKRVHLRFVSQIFYLVSAFPMLPKQWFTVMNSSLLFVSVRYVPSFYNFSWALKYTDLTQGLYPTLIVILVGMQLSPVEYHSTQSTGIHFARDPAPVPPSMLQHVYRIGRESVSDADTQVPSVASMKISEEVKSLFVE